LRLWDLESGQTISTPDGHKKWVNSVAVSPDGDRAVSASHDQTLRVWDFEGKSLGTLEGHTNSVTAVAVTCDGRAISASEDQTLRPWNLKSCKSIASLDALTSEFRHPILSPEYQSVRGWLLEGNETVQTPDGHANWVNSVAVTPDGRLAISASGHQMRLWDLDWDLESGEAIFSLEGHTDVVYAVGVTSDGRRAVSASRDRLLLLWDLETGKAILPRFEGHPDAVYAVAVTPDGRFAISGSLDRTLLLWDLESDRPRTMGMDGARKPILPLEGHTDAIYCVALTPDGRRAVSGSRDGTLILWDLKTEKAEKKITTFTGEGAIMSCAVAPDGQTIIAGDNSGRVYFLRLVEADETKPSIGDAKFGSSSTRSKHARSATDLTYALVAAFKNEKGKALREPSFPHRKSQRVH
jgi:WD40 repeat protein